MVHARLQILWLKKKLFCGGQGETIDKAQLRLELGILEKRVGTITVCQARDERVKEEIDRVSAAERFEKLPVKETIEITPEKVKAAPERYEKIGEQKTFEVDIIPPQLGREIIRGKYRHRSVCSRPHLFAPVPARVVPGGYVSAGLLACVMIAKYFDHSPLYRQQKQWERYGLRISRQTMVDWVAQSASWLEIIYRRCTNAFSPEIICKPTNRPCAAEISESLGALLASVQRSFDPELLVQRQAVLRWTHWTPAGSWKPLVPLTKPTG